MRRTEGLEPGCDCAGPRKAWELVIKAEETPGAGENSRVGGTGQVEWEGGWAGLSLPRRGGQRSLDKREPWPRILSYASSWSRRESQGYLHFLLLSLYPDCAIQTPAPCPSVLMSTSPVDGGCLKRREDFLLCLVPTAQPRT